ncbi:hypothetical protein GZH47_32015 (plasmid) [Paenibacillus rhizovicinus]|uniref:Mannosylglycerate hydrolase MGH1-like glycoside hydrolase domain-containing protein n=1 Tax=Paenibacillus rhizovicinus TaxID=2704463 RepID=A0A6C0PAQ5_9BACL|nr:trehalase family glycosidase [Paenibacillus rhizovicinus]QHW35516.1 hypothetical protein GZH47_32015 [Paenibacillus rhizovicinus]
MNFDLREVPFSRYGSYIAFNRLPDREGGEAGLYLRTVHGDATPSESFRIEVIYEGRPVDFVEKASPSCLILEADHGSVAIILPDDNTVRVQGSGAVGIRFVKFKPVPDPNVHADYAIHLGGDRLQVNAFGNRCQFGFRLLQGTMLTNVPFGKLGVEPIVIEAVPQDGECFELSIRKFETSWIEPDEVYPFNESRLQIENEFAAWLDRMPDTPGVPSDAAVLAGYINWSSMVAPTGHIKRPAMFMAKNFMTNVWSWDHCFNAMALVYHDPALAWEQFIFPFDHQDAFGMLPDSVNDKLIIRNFTKPPVHGWALKRMMERNVAIGTPDKLAEIYGPLCRWTEWWFQFRDDDGDGIPQYNHGNDSGWDNSTIFEDVPVESPDLSAYLVIQMEVLSDIAAKLGKIDQSRAWRERAERLLEAMLDHFWTGESFVARRNGDHKEIRTDSLILTVPIILGRRLPESVRQSLIAQLQEGGKLLTPYGLASESPGSSKYEPDGYWRGPIWAPSTLIVADGIRESGETELASEIGRRFCAMASKFGMAENFDALTGRGLRDRAYTWTSSVFLILAHEYLSGM